MKYTLIGWLLIIILGISYLLSFFMVHAVAMWVWLRTDESYTMCRIVANQYWFNKLLEIGEERWSKREY